MIIPQPKFQEGERVYYSNPLWKWANGIKNRVNTAVIEATEYSARGHKFEGDEKFHATIKYHLNDGSIQYEDAVYKNEGDV